MAQTSIKTYNWYDRYKVESEDLTGLQNGIFQSMEGARESLAVLYGLQVVPKTAMTVTVKAGVAVNSAGRLLVLATDTDVVMASPVANPCKSLLVLRPVTTDSDNIAEPTDPLTTVPLTETRTATAVALNGTAAGSPSYPSTTAGDLVLMGFNFNSGHVTVVVANYDLTKRNGPRSREKQITQVAANYSVIDQDEIIEVDASGGAVTVTLLAANLFHNRQLVIVKTDSSANAVTVSSAQNISGQSTQSLTDQWDTMTIYSNAVRYIMT